MSSRWLMRGKQLKVAEMLDFTVVTAILFKNKNYRILLQNGINF